MYVVSGDKGMRLAASESNVLLPIENIESLLSLCTAAETPSIRELLDPLIESKEFLNEVYDAVIEGLPSLSTKYIGGLIGAEVCEVDVSGSIEIIDSTILQVTPEAIGALLTLSVPIAARVDYEAELWHFYNMNTRIIDSDGAPKPSSADIRESAILKAYVLIDRSDMSTREIELTSTDILVH
jgi:hypothetical protein